MIEKEFPTKLLKPYSYRIEVQKISSILHRINSSYYGNKNEVKIKFVENNNIKSETLLALPNDTILVTRKFLDLISAIPFSQ